VLQTPKSMVPACQIVNDMGYGACIKSSTVCVKPVFLTITSMQLACCMFLMHAMVFSLYDSLVRARSCRSTCDDVSQLRECLQNGQHRWLLQAPQQAAQCNPQRDARLHIPAGGVLKAWSACVCMALWHPRLKLIAHMDVPHWRRSCRCCHSRLSLAFRSRLAVEEVELQQVRPALQHAHDGLQVCGRCKGPQPLDVCRHLSSHTAA
jgi:hypothetical protein